MPSPAGWVPRVTAAGHSTPRDIARMPERVSPFKQVSAHRGAAATTLRRDAVLAGSSRSASVVVVLASVVFVPSAPLLVPALSGPAAVETESVREATLGAAAELARVAPRWIAVGASDGDPRDVGVSGTFAAYGVDHPVSLEVAAPGDPTTRTGGLPLSMLIAAWLRGESKADSVTPVLVGVDASSDECARIGAELADRIAADPEPIGVLVVGDGAISLSARAPGGGLRDEAVVLQGQVDAAIASADTATLAGLDIDRCAAESVAGRPAWQVAAGLCGDRPMAVDVRYADAPFGVGYTVAVWTPR
ncbi:hypothetical protein AAFP35_09690 [Gordonia sp. CPCC 206044]|uniref:hypothetical protein n=1 Tax=Gordonia sp. CPCC 206044 TaxID=3140793 RepID=UPI003AF33C7F